MNTRRYAACSLLLVVLLSPTCAAQTTRPSPPPPPTTRPADVEKLIAQLGSSDFRAREAAHKEIVAMGDAAVAERIKRLQSESADLEVQQHARAILQEIATNSVTGPSLVTLHFKNASARTVYESLFKQAGAALKTRPADLFQRQAPLPGGGGGAALPDVTIDLERVPFWEAIRALEAQTGISPSDSGREFALSNERNRWPIQAADSAYVSGPFMVVADDRFGRGTIHRLKVFVEPRIRVMGCGRFAAITEAKDANGRPIALQAMPRMPDDLERAGGNAFDAHIIRPIPNAATLKGVVRARLLVREQAIEIKDVAKANNLDKVVEGRRFLVNAMNPEPGDWFITLIAYNNPPIKGLERMRITLSDENGVALSEAGSGSGSNGRRVDFHLEFQQGPNCGPPSTLMLSVPLETRDIAIPFEFGPPDAEKQKPPPAGQPRNAEREVKAQ